MFFYKTSNSRVKVNTCNKAMFYSKVSLRLKQGDVTPFPLLIFMFTNVIKDLNSKINSKHIVNDVKHIFLE